MDDMNLKKLMEQYSQGYLLADECYVQGQTMGLTESQIKEALESINEDDGDDFAYSDYSENLSETQTSGQINGFTPENVISVSDKKEEEKPLTEQQIKRQARRQQIREGKDDITESEKVIYYKEQEWTNGKNGQPSDYEKWRKDVITKGKNSRIERDDKDFRREKAVGGMQKKQYRNPYSSNLNQTEDSFLGWALENGLIDD